MSLLMCSIFLPPLPGGGHVNFRVRVLPTLSDRADVDSCVLDMHCPGSNSDILLVAICQRLVWNYLDPAGVSERPRRRVTCSSAQSLNAFGKSNKASAANGPTTPAANDKLRRTFMPVRTLRTENAVYLPVA